MKRTPRVYRYAEIATELRQEIAAGLYARSGRLPSERALMQRFEVQRNTVRRALETLEFERVLQLRPNRGYFILSDHPMTPTPRAQAGNVLLVCPRGDSTTSLGQIFEGVTRVLRETPFTVMRFDSSPQLGSVLHRLPSLDSLEARDAVGMILWPSAPVDNDLLRQWRQRIPIVTVDRRVPGFETDCVRTDDVEGGRLVTSHLLNQGHRRIAFLADDVFTETVQLRWYGYALAHEDSDVQVDPSMFISLGGNLDERLWLLLRPLLKDGSQKVTAIVCSNDVVASQLLRFLRQDGYRVPGDVAVTGFGDLLPDFTEAMDLTSVSQPLVQVGETAARVLIERIEYPLPSHETVDTRVPVRLVVRQSSRALMKV